MNTLENKVHADMITAMKNKEKEKTSCLKMLKTAFMEYKTSPNGNREPEDADLMKIIQKLAKQRKETGELYKSQNRPDLAEHELFEYEVLSEYLPKMLSEDEVTKIVEETIKNMGATTMKDMGKVMGFINKTYAGQVDGSMVSTIVKSKLA